MNLVQRKYQPDDYWRIRAFLREVYLLNDRRELCWQAYRFDYWRWHAVANIEHFQLDDALTLWETAGGEMAAVLHPEGRGEAFLQVHPAWRSPDLEAELITVAEQQLAHSDASGSPSLTVWCNEHNAVRRQRLIERGYTKGDWPEYLRRRSITSPIADVPLAPGYGIRSLGDGAELIERCYASGLAFHPDDVQYAIDNRDVTWYRNIQNAPLYRRDLDLVAIAPDGSVAAFCTIWFDDVTRTGSFEPVATVPTHQRQGLGKAVMTEGLRRLQRLGATQSTVGSYSVHAGALYASMGFTDYDLSECWLKTW
jgi:GNAT superfamily N-acetyltransferase